MKSVVRLYSQFHPQHYALTLRLDKAAMVFTGSVVVRGRKVGQPTQRITLHGKDLKIVSASIVKHDKKGEQTIALDRVNRHRRLEEIRLHSKEMIYPGEYTVALEFSGQITRGMTGIYPCFFDYEGEQHALLMTQFESHSAREAFPCIDEPEAKAEFDLTLDTVPGETVLSNTPIASQEELDGRLITSFATTPKMSSYLLAFVCGELQSKSTQTTSGVDVSVWATVAQPADALDFPLDIAKRSIEYFEDYFGVEYPLPKADHVACPDFSAGAMENWGLITYRERALLVYPDETAQSVQEYIATVIAHETSHQWFGNLVTMKWWDDLWLNESFANMMEYQAVDAMHPEWRVWDSFIAQEGLSALRRDATPGVQAVRVAVNHPEEISTLFDPSIVYAKGGRLLYMLKNYIGDEAFRKGLSAYFRKHAYGNTTGADLWAALSETSGEDIGAFMNPWLERSGFPVVSITQTGPDVKIEQEHFLDNPSKADPDRLWPVPLFSSASAAPLRFDEKIHAFQLPAPDFVTLNDNARGHYIVRYTTDAHKRFIAEAIASQTLGEADRLMLLNGGSMLARAGYEPYSNILKMLSAYQAEASQPVWNMIGLVIAETRRFIDLDETLEGKIKRLIRKLIAKQYERLGWEGQPGEPSSDQKLRAAIIGIGSYADEPHILDQAQQLFTAYQDSPQTVPAELRGTVFAVPIKQHTPKAFEYLLHLHDTTHNSDLKADICGSLTATRHKDEADKLLARLKDPDVIKPQDADHWLIALLRNRHVRDVAWEWLVDNWRWIEDTYKQDSSYIMLPRYAASIVNTPAWAEKYRDFFSSKEDEVSLKRNIQMGLEEITARTAWLERDLGAVQAFFNDTSGDTSGDSLLFVEK